MLLPVALLCACGQRPLENSTTKAIAVAGDTISIGQDSPVLPRLKIESVQRETYRAELSASGVVKAIPSHYAEIASPFAGRITKSFVRLGQKLSPGSPVFEVSSPAFFESGRCYYQAKQEMELALKSLNREKVLMNNKVGVQKELEEAEMNYELRKKDFENAEAALKVFRVNTDELTLGQPLAVTSPISGEVVADRLVIGQFLKEDAEPVVIIADLSRVWMAAHVKEKDLSLIQTADEVEIRLVAFPDKAFTGKIYHVSEMLDEETRSTEVLITCDNSARMMKPGMYGTVRLSNREADIIRIPVEAILQGEDFSYVLIPVNSNSFVKRKITTGTTCGGKTIVTDGLREGERIVASGAYYFIDAR